MIPTSPLENTGPNDGLDRGFDRPGDLRAVYRSDSDPSNEVALPDDLRAVAQAWPDLPDAIRTAILAMVRSVRADG